MTVNLTFLVAQKLGISEKPFLRVSDALHFEFYLPLKFYVKSNLAILGTYLKTAFLAFLEAWNFGF